MTDHCLHHHGLAPVAICNHVICLNRRFADDCLVNPEPDCKPAGRVTRNSTVLVSYLTACDIDFKLIVMEQDIHNIVIASASRQALFFDANSMATCSVVVPMLINKEQLIWDQINSNSGFSFGNHCLVSVIADVHCTIECNGTAINSLRQTFVGEKIEVSMNGLTSTVQ